MRVEEGFRTQKVAANVVRAEVVKTAKSRDV